MIGFKLATTPSNMRGKEQLILLNDHYVLNLPKLSPFGESQGWTGDAVVPCHPSLLQRKQWLHLCPHTA